MLKALGAEIIRTPTEAAWDSPESHIGVAIRLNKEIPNSHILDQYINPSNPLAHYEGTAEELYDQCDGKIDYVICSAGTGGTITGVAKKLKEKIPGVKIIGVDPKGSILAQPDELNEGPIAPYQVEGIGYDFIPEVLDRSLIDKWIKTEDKESFLMARRLIREEGLLCGGSSGAAMVAALKIAKELPEGKRVVVILPDSVRNYMTKFLNDGWMAYHGFLDEVESRTEAWWSNKPISVLDLKTPVTVLPTVKCKQVIEIMKKGGFDQVPVVDSDSKVLGVITEGNLTSYLTKKRASPDDPVEKILYKQFKQVTAKTTLGELSLIFDKDPYVLVSATQKVITDSSNELEEKCVVTAVVTRIDLLNYIMKHEDENH